MRPREIRDTSEAELAQKERDLREELFRLRLRGATGQIENKMRARLVRRDLARVLTVQRERGRSTAGAPAASGK
jgi:large subunit ribosomal protein L29